MEKCLTLRKLIRILSSVVAPLPVSLAFSGNGFIQFSSTGGGNSDLSWLNQLGPERGGNSAPSTPPDDSKRNRRMVIILIIILILLLAFCCVLGFALYRAGVISTPPSDLTATSSSGGQTNCQDLIDRAMQSSGDSCDHIGANEVCYGNNTLMAELVPGTLEQFRQRGDTVGVGELRRLAASPLSLTGDEWGIAVFTVMANLPRSLPGETITMVVFGNTTLNNPSNNMQTFYFSSILGQIECGQVPFDGLMITMPDGAGVSFVINGAEMMLMGNASINATQNGSMEVSMYSGSAYISANGGSQFVTAGESTSMDLGGPNGTSAISPPSAPEPLSPEELALACTMTGQFCSREEITPVSQQDAVATLLAQLGVTPNPTATTLILPSSTPTVTPSLTLTPSKSVTPSLTVTPSRTVTSTRTRTRTPTLPATATSAGTAAATSALTNTPVAPTSTITQTDTPAGPAACANASAGSISNSPQDFLVMPITNSSGGQITLDILHVNWVKSPSSQEINDIHLNGNELDNDTESSPPSDYPSEEPWDDYPNDHHISNGATNDLEISFNDDLMTGTYYIKATFDIGCFVDGSYTVP